MTPIPNALNYHSGGIVDHVARRQGLPAAAPFRKAAKAIAWGNMRLPDMRRLAELTDGFEKSAGKAATAVVRAHLRAMYDVVRDAVCIAAAGMVERTVNTRSAYGPDEAAALQGRLVPDEVERLLDQLMRQTSSDDYSFGDIARTVRQLQTEIRSVRDTRFAGYDDAAWSSYDATPLMLKYLGMVGV